MPSKRKEQTTKSSNQTLFSESPWHIAGFLRKLDRFGYPIPTFNIKGADKVTTAIGGMMTAIILTFTLGYFISKL